MPCRDVHTFGMRQTLSLLFLDREGNIIGREPSAKPWRVFAMRGADSVLEMAQKTTRELDLIELEIVSLGRRLFSFKNHHKRWIKARVQDTTDHNV